ncbi:unnamed protein product [Cuscuta europaea]|uniref:IST1-like protein n=1 Tax=Cuscuta europaea TaxID=41803 RepID=A0A9P1EGY5_CUSEU|nr:unnamed protein product [Cuscuta europaea]
MGRRIDAFFGKNVKKSGDKFRATASLAISRLAVLKKQRHARCSIARSDVLQLLHLSHHQRALLRVEQVIKEQNMLDVLLMVEGYCFLLLERVIQLEHQKDCPDELKEAISSLIFAASRCGDFPELQELQALFSSKFGKEFTARAVDLRNNCGVNPKMIQKLSTRTPSYESRLMVLKEIAQENNIILKIDDTDEESTKVYIHTSYLIFFVYILEHPNYMQYPEFIRELKRITKGLQVMRSVAEQQHTSP